jgi:membrane peptidoglycan carboxypeptidase
MSIGYEIEVTPLQLAQAYGAIANDGVLAPARIVLGRRDEDGRFIAEEVPEPRRVVSSRTAVTMMNMMEGVVLRGTGENARVSGYHIAGKTGTAKKVLPGKGIYTTNDYFGSFGGFGPLREPKLVGFVVMDTPRGGFYYGGLVAAPVFSRIMADALAYLGVPPDDDPWEARRDELAEKNRKGSKKSPRPNAKEEAEEDDAPERLVTTAGQVPDVRGKTAREAVAGLIARGYRARIDGTGVVVRQTPPAGAELAAAEACTLHLGDADELLEEQRHERAKAKADAPATLFATSRTPRPAPRNSRPRR